MVVAGAAGLRERDPSGAVRSAPRRRGPVAQAARREGERIITEATGEVAEYRNWLSGVISEAERLYRIQTQSLDAAESAIHQSRSRLESAFTRLADLQRSVIENLNSDDTIINAGPIRVASQRTKPALSAPKKSAKKPAKKTAKKAVAKKSASRK